MKCTVAGSALEQAGSVFGCRDNWGKDDFAHFVSHFA
jgi:hypothetical protein